MAEEIKKYADPILDATPRKATDPEDQAMYDEYFARGGKVTVVDKDARTENLNIKPWQRSRGRPKASEKK